MISRIVPGSEGILTLTSTVWTPLSPIGNGVRDLSHLRSSHYHHKGQCQLFTRRVESVDAKDRTDAERRVDEAPDRSPDPSTLRVRLDFAARDARRLNHRSLR